MACFKSCARKYQFRYEIGLTRDERVELARVILWRDIESWAGLTDEQVGRLLDAMEGFEKIVHLLSVRSPE
jgi:hypothetical protein